MEIKKEIAYYRREYGDWFIEENPTRFNTNDSLVNAMRSRLAEMNEKFENLRCFELTDGALNEREVFQYIQMKGLGLVIDQKPSRSRFMKRQIQQGKVPVYFKEQAYLQNKLNDTEPQSPLKLTKSESSATIKDDSTQSSSGEKIEITIEDLSATMPAVKNEAFKHESLPALYEQHEDVIIYYQA